MKNITKIKNKKLFITFILILVTITIVFSMPFNNNKSVTKVNTLSKIFAEGGTPTGWQFIDGYWYYIESLGVYKTGWYYSDNNWYYFDTDGKMVTGIKYIEENSAYYYFSEKESTIGIMQTGWKRSGDNWYYLNSDGKAKVNEWYSDGGSNYYFKEDGKLAKGVTYVPSDDEYYFLSMVDATYGMMEKSKWVEYNGNWYYINDDGRLAKNTFKSTGNNYLYYFDEDGKMATGFREISGNTYYFSKKTSGDSINNVEVHIKNQTDLNNYLSTTGQNMLGDRVYFENTSNIQFPADSVYYLDITSNGLAGGDYTTYWYLTSKSTGNIDFNSSTFLIGDKTALYMHVTGDHNNQQVKNGSFFGSISAVYSGGQPYANRGSFNADIIHASNITFKNLEFNNVQEVEDHVLDVMGSDHITFDNLSFRGFLNDYSSSELDDIYYHYGYKEAIQIDVSSSISSGISDLDKTPIFNNDLIDDAPSSYITITNSYFGPYNGPTGQNIINKNDVTTIRPFGPTIGSHVKGYNYNNITITNNTFANTFCINNISDKKYLYPIHLMPVLDSYDVSNNTFINQCGYSGDNGDADSWETKGFYGKNDNNSSGNAVYNDNNINSTSLDISSIKSKVNTLSYSYGLAQTGFVNDDSNTYYFRTSDNEISNGPKASMVLGLVNINSNTYYFRDTTDSNGPKGSMIKDECKVINNTYYCFNELGVGQSYVMVSIPTSDTCLNPTYDGTAKFLASAQTGYALSNNSETNAGNYTVTASLSGGYVWSDYSTSDKTFECSISKANLEAPIITDYSGVYDGYSHQVSLTNSSGKTVNYSTDGIIYSNTIPSRTNAGTTDVYVKYIGNNNYNDSSVSTGSINISKADTTIARTNELNEVTEGYEGSILSISSNVAGIFTFSTEDSNLEITTGPTSVSANETIDLNINALSNGSASIDIIFVPTNSTNYNGYQDTKNLTINEQIIVNSVATIPTANDYCKSNLIYDGSEKTLTNAHGEGYTFVNNTGTNAGSYTVSAVLDEHYEWSDTTQTNKTFECSIGKANLATPSVTSYEGVYDGYSHQVTLNNSTGKTVNYSTDGTNYSNSIPSRTNAGTTTVYVKYLGNQNYNDSSVSTGTISISKDSPVITITDKTSEFTIDDSKKVFTISSNIAGIFTFSSDGEYVEITTGPVNAPANQEINVSINAIKKGYSSVNISFVPTDSTNYNTYSSDEAVYISNKVATIPTSNDYCKSNLVYSGEEQTLTNSHGEGYTFSNNKGTNAGDYTVTATLNNKYDWSDSTISDKTFICNIAKADINNFTVTSYENVYDGNSHGLNVSNVTGGTVKYSTDNVNYQTSPITRTDYGTTTVYVYAEGDINHNNSSVKSGTITINKACSNIIVSELNTTDIIKGNTNDILSLTSGVSGTFNISLNDNLLTSYQSEISVNANQNVTFSAVGSAVGTTTLNLEFIPDSSNYESYSNSYSITVNINPDNVISIPTSSSCLNNVTYDGTVKTLTVADTESYEFINNTGTNAGSYTVSAKLKEGYEWSDHTVSNKTFECSIEKADQVAPSTVGSNVTYDGVAHYITVTNASGKTVHYSTNGTNYSSTVPSRTNAGTTTVYVKFLGDSNYNDSEVVSETINISKANPSISVTNYTDNFTVGDTSKLFTVSSSVAGLFTFTTESEDAELSVGFMNVSANHSIDVNLNALRKSNPTITLNFVPTDTTNYNSRTADYNVTINNHTTLKPDSNYCKNLIRYTGSEQVLTNDPGEGYIFINNTGINAGTYNVAAHLNNGYEWENHTLDDVVIECTILKEHLDDFTVTGYNHSYDGQPHSVTVSNISGGTIQYKLYDGEWQTEPITRTDAGTTSLYVRYKGDQNHYDSDVKSASINISTAVPNVEFSLVGIGHITQYNTEDFATGSAEIPGTFTFTLDDEILDNYQSSIHANANETVTFSARGLDEGNTTLHLRFIPDSTNYQMVTQNYGVTVWPSTETVDVPTASVVCLDNLVYNGNVQTLTKSSVPAYQYSNNTGTNAGNYNVTVSLASGYKWSDDTTEDKTVVCSIGKANLEIPTITGYSSIYDGNPHTINVSLVGGGTIKYSLDNENYTNFVPSRTDAGNTLVYVKYIGDNNHNDSSVYSANINISKADSVISTLNLVETIEEDETIEIGPIHANTNGIFTISSNDSSKLTVPVIYESVDASEDITINITGASVGDTSYTITFTPSNTNYNASSVTTDITVTEKAKTSVLIPTSNLYCKLNLKYTGSPLTITNDPEVGYTFSNNVQTNAGTYEVTATLQDGYIWSDNTLSNKTFNCTILNQDNYLTFSNNLIVNNNYITPKLNPGITHGDIKSMIDTNGVVTSSKSDSEIVATCDTLSITIDSITNIYTLIVTGDITKNGLTTSDDVNLLFRYLRNKETLSECQLKASDTTNDNSLFINDVAKLYQFINGKIERLSD